jgi:glycogen(starch) synthase
MRVLFLTNFFPPASRGGYELWCHEVATNLQTQGHDILILTSRYSSAQTDATDLYTVHRELYLEMELTSFRNSIQFFTVRKAREMENLDTLHSLVQSFDPDCILVWGMWNLSRSIAALCEQLLPGRVAYYIGDYWPTLPSQYEFYWESPARHRVMGMPKRFLAGIAHRLLDHQELPTLRFEHVLFPTVFMRDELKRRGMSPENSSIIYGGVDTSHFMTFNSEQRLSKTEDIHLLYVGRLTADKGVHTAFEAMGILVHHYQNLKVKLLIVGSGDQDYENHLHHIVKKEKIESNVLFLGAQPIEFLPKIFYGADIFIFTSIWPEPFGRVLVEAMASGIPIVGTATGGSAEILIDNVNSLLYPPGDSIQLAGKIIKLIDSQTLRCRLGQNGQKMAIDKFGIERMATEIEAYLTMMIDK